MVVATSLDVFQSAWKGICDINLCQLDVTKLFLNLNIINIEIKAQFFMSQMNFKSFVDKLMMKIIMFLYVFSSG